jgi:hypothetical protein
MVLFGWWLPRILSAFPSDILVITRRIFRPKLRDKVGRPGEDGDEETDERHAYHLTPHIAPFSRKLRLNTNPPERARSGVLWWRNHKV